MMAQHDSSGLVARLAAQRAAYSQEPWPTLAVRRDRLKRLRALTRDHGTEIAASIDADFGGRSVHETRLAELFLVEAAISHAQAHLRRWTQPRRVATAARFWPARNRLMPQPLGVVGVVAPWNYPFQLAIGPVVAAIAAGNRVMLKPSELTPSFSALLARLVAALFDADELHVTTGGVDVGRAFAALPFDHLFFTGSTAVGREVAMAAAANLTPVTLELGGKSPAILDPSADITQAARRIAFGKLLNAGQTCIAPDYLMIPRGSAAEVTTEVGNAVRALYPTISDNPDYSAIISDKHRSRLAALVQDARDKGASVVEPVPLDAATNARKMAPTLLLGANASMRVMQEEIFGPVLPIIEYDGLDDAIAHVVAGERPLALYWFGTDARSREHVLRETHAGGVTVNDCLWHLAQEDQPFGGIGASGSGSYHGEWGFRTFSHLKPVLYQPAVAGTRFFQPPYGKTFEAMLGALQKLV